MTSDRESRLLRLARDTINTALHNGTSAVPLPGDLDPDLMVPGAAFVTLRTASTGALRGCVGSLEAHRPLGVDVAAHALDAAFRDPRFLPLTDTSDIRIDISVLGPLEPFVAAGYDDLVARLPVGFGVLVTTPRHRATYLPAVWLDLPEPERFVAFLWQKGGLLPRSWPSEIEVFTYSVSEFSED